jgi:methylmalonyl-CoA mutase
MSTAVEIYKPRHAVRVVTATALFDGHDASIGIFRRILQATGVEVIHLGHNRSAHEIVDAAIQEDAQGIAVSSYQGGHVDFFKYLVDLLGRSEAGHIQVFGGGGGVIVPEEVRELQDYGVARIYGPEDGARMGLQGIVNDLVRRIDCSRVPATAPDLAALSPVNRGLTANLITAMEHARSGTDGHLGRLRDDLRRRAAQSKAPVVGVTGTGGSGKSSLTDELVLRLLSDFDNLRLAVISADPTRRKTGGALLGDRIRMNAIDSDRVFMRSMATRASATEIPEALADAVTAVRASGYDLVVVETAGIGQGDSSIVDLVDVSVYVMTGEFGAPSQLEKIDMLDFADLVAVNKYDKRGSQDAVRDVRKQVQRNRGAFDRSVDDMPVYGTIAARFNDDGVTALYHGLLQRLEERTGRKWPSGRPRPHENVSTAKSAVIPPRRVHYLAEIAAVVRGYHQTTRKQAEALRRVWHLSQSERMLSGGPADESADGLLKRLGEEIEKARRAVDPATDRLVDQWRRIRTLYDQEELVYEVRGHAVRTPLTFESLSRRRIPKIALPRTDDPGDLYQWLRSEHLPGYFPFTAGVFPLKRTGEEPTRMFAGEGDPARTNRRFKLLSADSAAKRLSTAFDSVTLYGFDPDRRPDIYGKVGNAGVSVCTLDDVKTLYAGFDLCAPDTSVSMTINGPAPIMLAMFFNAAIDQQVERFRAGKARAPDADEYNTLRAHTLATVRGTVQADILKEDQGQNTCIFAMDFALKMMGDIQQYFIDHQVRNFYSVSISGYHIAEAGANPISQLAFTLANGFTYLEYYLARGMEIDRFGPNLSFFFSNGMDPEYTVIGRVARRIWAVALRDKYGASERSQMLKYHIQTSGRSLHSQDIQLNDIRTTLQALCAVYDNAQSLHTNAFDEAITTPTEESVRRALAIQLIINREWGLAKNENPLQGSFIVDELTDLVEEAVLAEFDRLSERGGVLGAMETGYQRSRIQEESLHYERLKHSGQLPIIGVNTFRDPHANDEMFRDDFTVELARSTEEEKQSQLRRLADFKARNAEQAHQALARLKDAVLSGDNIFAELMESVRYCSLGQITRALYAVGGQYRRNM